MGFKWKLTERELDEPIGGWTFLIVIVLFFVVVGVLASYWSDL